MADELTITASLALVKNNISATKSVSAITVDVAGTGYQKGVQNIGTSEEAIAVGGVGTNGYIMITNLDATNYVKVRPATGVADLIRIAPGDVCLFRCEAAAPFAIADTAACDIEVMLVES